MKKYWLFIAFLGFPILAMEPNVETSSVSQEDLWTKMTQATVKFYQDKFPEQDSRNLEQFAWEALDLLPTLEQGLKSLDFNWLQNQADGFFGFYMKNDQNCCEIFSKIESIEVKDILCSIVFDKKPQQQNRTLDNSNDLQHQAQQTIIEFQIMPMIHFLWQELNDLKKHVQNSCFSKE